MRVGAAQLPPAALVVVVGHGDEQQHSRAAGQRGQQPHDARKPPVAFAGEDEAGERQDEEERLGVDGLQEEGQRADGEIDDRPGRHLVVEVGAHEAVEQPHAARVADQRDHDAGDHEVAAEGQTDVAQQHGEQREERGAAVAVGVAAGGDLDVPDAVPVRPGVQQMTERSVEHLGAHREAPADGQALDADEGRGDEGGGEDEQAAAGGSGDGPRQRARRRRAGSRLLDVSRQRRSPPARRPARRRRGAGAGWRRASRWRGRAARAGRAPRRAGEG